MALAVRDIWTTLIRLGVLDPAAATDLAQQAPVANLAGSAEEASVAVVKQLVAQGVLTKFQAKRLLAQRGGELKQGQYLVLDRIDQPPLSRWLRAKQLPTGDPVLIYPSTAAADAKNFVDPAWLRPHASVTADGVQPLEVVQLSGATGKDDASWRGLVVSYLPDGQTLAQWLKDSGAMDPLSAIALGQVVGGALAAMHAASLFHGGVRPGRIWIGNDSIVYLLRCGGGPPIYPGDSPPAYDWFDDDGEAADYASPQWLSGEVHAGAQDDVYALGAVIYHMLTLRRVSAGQLPAEVADAVARGAQGHPLMRVLAAALAADPQQRFPDIASFLRALDAVQGLLASGTAATTAAVPGAATAAPAALSAADQPQPAETSSAETHDAAPLAARSSPAATPGAESGKKKPQRPDQAPAASQKPEAVQRSAPSQRPTAGAALAAGGATAAGAAASATAAAAAKRSKPAAASQAAQSAQSMAPGGAADDQTPAKEQPGKPAEKAAESAAPQDQPSATKVPAQESGPPRAAGRTGEVTPMPAAAAGVGAAADQTVASPAGSAAARKSPPADSAPPESTPAPPSTPSPAGSPPRRVRKRTRRSRRGPVIIGSSAVAILLVLVAVMLRSTQREPAPRPRPTLPATTPRLAQPSTTDPAGSTSAVSVAGGRTSPGASATGGFELVSDDRLLWVPPWPADAAPPPLELVTPGAQAIVALRPRRMLQTDAAADWQAWFGPELGPALESLQQRSGVSPQQIDRLIISLLAGRDGEPEVAFAVWLGQGAELRELRGRWNATASRTPEGQTIFAGDEPGADAYYVAGDAVDDSTSVSAFAFGTVEQMRLVAEGGGGPIPLPRALQTAWDQSSDQADLVVLVSPNFLFADGRKLLQRLAPRAIDPLRDLLIPDATAALLTIDTRKGWYAELRLAPGGSASAAGLMRSMQQRAAELPALAEAFLVQSDIAPSWRALAIRLPQYLRAMNDQTRFGVSESMATANFYLPAEAAPQMALASLLALSPSTPSPTAVAAAPAQQPQNLSIEQLLDTKLSISFDQESLEFAVSMIGEEFARSLPQGAAAPKITIIGGDLEKSGITQNQQIRDFQMRDAPLRDVLTRLVLGANPDKTATGPADPKQSLLWVVAPSATPQAPELLVTTRPEAQAKGYELPREFTP